MRYDPAKHHRRSIRLKDYHYGKAGAYFVSICAHARECVFGEIIADEVRLTEAGLLVQETWYHLPDRFPSVELDSFVVMPNHVHGILLLEPWEKTGRGRACPTPGKDRAAEGGASPAPTDDRAQEGRASPAPTLGSVIGAYKSISAISVNRILDRVGRPLWQRNYFEHVIRNDQSLAQIRQYIVDNPVSWASDSENPQVVQHEVDNGSETFFR